MLQVTDNEVKDRLQFDNPWWVDAPSIEKRYLDYPRRSYFNSFYELVSDREIQRAIILLGPRRVGKTVMAYHSIQNLFEDETPAQNILYLSLETPVYTGLTLEQLVNLYTGLHSLSRNDKLYIYFDEIQYLKDWEVHLKSLVDSYPDYKFIATGSAAAALRMKSKESGAGRFTDFLLPPLTFAEYLTFIKKDKILIDKSRDETERLQFRATNVDELNKEFINYLNYGGYPEAVFSDRIQAESSRYIKSDIIDKVLLRDLPSLYGINDIQELNRLFTTLAYNTGNEVTLEELSKSSGVAKNTLKRYLEYLEAAFLVKRIFRVDQNCKRFKRATSFKVYLTNPSMRSALFGYVNSESESVMGALTETAIYSQWFHSEVDTSLYYARWSKGEIDIVCLDRSTQKPNWLVEVKWSDRPVKDHRLLKNVIEFSKTNNLHGAPLVTTKTRTFNSTIDGLEIRFRPSSEYAYTLGANILNRKQHN